MALEWAGFINSKSPTAMRMLKYGLNLPDAGLVGPPRQRPSSAPLHPPSLQQGLPWKSDRTQAETDIIKRADALLGQVDQLLTAAQNARLFALRVASALGAAGVTVHTPDAPWALQGASPSAGGSSTSRARTKVRQSCPCARKP